MIAAPPSPAAAYWNQRLNIKHNSEKLRQLRLTLDDPINLSSVQWAQWYAYGREYRPELVIELGRGKGNSTACFAEALHQNEYGRLISLCLTNSWDESSARSLRPLVEEGWFDRVDARMADICRVDFSSLVGNASRILILWDAHGFDVAEAVLGRLLPIVQDREHMVILHDVSDRRYCNSEDAYGEATLWRGLEWAERTGRHDCRLYLGWINTIVDQAVAVVDFLTRNRSELQSADHSFHQEIGSCEDRVKEMAVLLSPEDWSMVGHWAYFSLNNLLKPYTFPNVTFLRQ